jgi:pilus assembly protein FimV
VSKSSLAITAAAVALAATFAAQAAGLGRLTVLSPLGAPLNAEIEIVSLQPGEEDGLTARIASAEAFAQAGIEPPAALSAVRFAIVRRAGRPYIRVTSSQPMNEPFVDLLVELEWNGGRLVREYTFLLDPPEYKGPQAIAAAPAVAAPAVAAPAAAAPAAAAPQPSPAAPESPAPADAAAAPGREGPAAQPLPATQPPSPSQAGAPASDATSYQVRRGDTLGEIARAHLPAGVTLNQMLIAIYRANQDAFIRENINLVRAGRVLNLPNGEAVSEVSAQEANRLVQSHRAEWNEYRSRLAAVPAPAEGGSGQRAVSGRIEAAPEGAPPAAAAEDQVRLAKADPNASGAAASAARADDAAARERELREAQSRVTDLEKNLADLQKLLEMKNQQLAELEKKAADTPKPPAASEAPKPAAVAPAPTPAPVEAKAAEPAPQPAPQPKAEAPKPKAEAPKPKPKAAPPPPPSLLDEFLENQIALAGLAAVVVLLLGYALWSWRRKKAAQAKFSDSVLGAEGEDAGSAADPSAAEPSAGSQASVSQASGLEAEEVDPIAEADVYLAYGRDAQAEEILREALQKDPNRLPVHGKLLEIYAKRNDAQAFEQTALKLKSLTSGSGPEWDKAVALGRALDPRNGLYGAGAAAAPAQAAAVLSGAAAAFAAAAATATTSTPAVDFDLGSGSSPNAMTTDIPFEAEAKAPTPSTIDFDLGSGTTPPSAPQPTLSVPSLDLDRPESDATITNIDFDLNTSPVKKSAPLPESAPLAAAGDSASGLDFDLNLDVSGGEAAPAMDLSSISLDLGSAGEPGGAPSNDPKWQEVATKLDLAKAYEEMGDKDGARELLGEVMKDGDAAQKGQAQQLLTKLG